MVQEQQSAEHRQATYFADTRSCDLIIVGSFVVIDDGLYEAHADTIEMLSREIL